MNFKYVSSLARSSTVRKSKVHFLGFIPVSIENSYCTDPSEIVLSFVALLLCIRYI